MRPIIANGPAIDFDAVRENGWACVPVEDAFFGDDVDRFVAAAGRLGATMLWLEAEDGPILEKAVPLEREAIEGVRLEAFGWHALRDGSDRFAVVTDGDLFHAICGPEAFVEACIGMTVDEGLRRFAEDMSPYARDPESPAWKLIEALSRTSAQVSAAAGHPSWA